MSLLFIFAGPSGATHTTITVAGHNLTDSVRHESLTLKLNSFDFGLVNPSYVPALGDALTMTLPTWSGTVVAIRQVDTPRGTDKFYSITATNAVVGSASAAPFGLSDAPDNVTTYGYAHLTLTTSRTPTGDEHRGMLTTFTDGLWPAMTVAITSANFGFVAANYTINDVTVTWPMKDSPEYTLELGDAMVPLSTWVATTASDDILPIDSTKITDGSITTPKLAANAVTAAKITAGTITATEIAAGAITTTQLNSSAVIQNVTNSGATVTIDSTGIDILSGALTIQDQFGGTVLGASGFSGSWLKFLESGGFYNSDFAVGDTSDIAVTEVSSSDTTVHYLAGLTTHLPYWVVKTSGGTLKLVTSANAPSGNALQSTASVNGQTNTVYQDIPAAPDMSYFINAWMALQYTAGTFSVTMTASFRNSDHAATGGSISLTFTQADVLAGGGAGVFSRYQLGTGVSPTDAAYMRVQVSFVHSTTVASHDFRLGHIAVQQGDLTAQTVTAGTGTFQTSYSLTLGGGNLAVDGFWRGGSSAFPGSPSTHDRYYRTDLEQWFYYDGTRWLTVQLFTLLLAQAPGAAALAASLAATLSTPMPVSPGSDIWLDKLYTQFFVNAGTALSGSHSWVGAFNKRPTGNTDTLVATVTINSGSSSVWRTDTTTIGALQNNGTTHYVSSQAWTKTGTPGNLSYYSYLTYRIVAT